MLLSYACLHTRMCVFINTERKVSNCCDRLLLPLFVNNNNNLHILNQNICRRLVLHVLVKSFLDYDRLIYNSSKHTADNNQRIRASGTVRLGYVVSSYQSTGACLSEIWYLYMYEYVRRFISLMSKYVRTYFFIISLFIALQSRFCHMS